MDYRAVRTDRFNTDYLNIMEYMQEQGASKNTLRRFEALFLSALESLEMFPTMFQIADFPNAADRNMRICNFDKWRILYTVEDGAIYLRRLLHQSQDISTKV